MPAEFQEVKVSIAMLFSDRLPYGSGSFQACLEAALAQDHGNVEVIIVDDRGPSATLELSTMCSEHDDRVRHLPGNYSNRAAMYNAALADARGEYLLALFNAEQQVVLRASAIRTMVMAAVRRGSAGMVYADYELIDADGVRSEIHLPDWHEGRLRETTDFGKANLFSIENLKGLGGFNEKYDRADIYDLRLRVAENSRPVHIANRFAGALYSVAAPAQAHNVFDYLLTDTSTQRELEDVLTDHLRRTGAYLAPGAHVRPIEYSADDERSFIDCIASVVIPVNNRPEFIGRAIQSVRSQTLPNIEVIVVVNGGEEDATADAVRRYLPDGDLHDPAAASVRLIVVDVNNLGLCLNTGIAAARGKYYVQLDSDDRLKPDAIEKLLAVFDSDPTVGMVIGSYEVWTLDEESGELVRNEEIPVVTHDEWTADNGRNNLLRINGAGAPRVAQVEAIRRAGWFGVNDDPSCRNYGEDYDLVLRISELYTIDRVWDPIYEVIRHAGGTDHSIDQATIDRNDDAKDHMRFEALRRRRELNREATR